MMTQTLLTQEQLAHLQQQADEFSKTFANAQYEMGEAQKFINALCMVYGVNWLHSVDFERCVKKANLHYTKRIFIRPLYYSPEIFIFSIKIEPVWMLERCSTSTATAII